MQTPEIPTIQPSEAAARRDSALLLDVRTPAEFGSMHIDGALLHPITELNCDFVRERAQGRQGCIVVCQSGGRARRAAEALVTAGLAGVSILEGGMNAWSSSGLPTKRGAKAISLERQVRITAGALVLLGVLLGYVASPAWYSLSAFIGAGLIFAGVTDTCGLGMLLARMPWNARQGATNPGVKPPATQGGSCCMR